MSGLIGGLFNRSDEVKMAALDHRLRRAEVLNANIANAETPGYRAIGYDFEEQLQSVAGEDDPFPMRATNEKHFRADGADADGTVTPEVYVRPTESVGHDGNTVDVDKEMAELAQNQIMFQSTAELINRKTGVLRYAINGGR